MIYVRECLAYALFRNFSYEMTDSAAKGSVAVVEVKVRNCDFSGIMDDYQKASYQYETGSFYMDVVNCIEKMGDFIINISQSVFGAKTV